MPISQKIHYSSLKIQVNSLVMYLIKSMRRMNYFKTAKIKIEIRAKIVVQLKIFFKHLEEKNKYTIKIMIIMLIK